MLQVNKIILVGKIQNTRYNKLSNGNWEIFISISCVDRRIKTDGSFNVNWFSVECKMFTSQKEIHENVMKTTNSDYINIEGKFIDDSYTRSDGTKCYQTIVLIEKHQIIKKKPKEKLVQPTFGQPGQPESNG